MLHRLEDFPGLAVLTSNLKDNLDEAFTRHFQSIIYFPVPTPKERYLLWQKSIPSQMAVDEAIDFCAIADR